MTRSAAFGVLRDACDLVPLLVGHYLRAGFDHVLIIDDGSTDGGGDVLDEAARLCPRLAVMHVESRVFEQQRIINDAAALLQSRGYELLVPFDADEFWMIDAASLGRELAKDGSARVLHGRWTNFVQSRDASEGSANFDGVRFRVPDGEGATRAEVEALARGFVEVQLRKVAVYGLDPIAFSLGQHRLVQGPAKSYPAEFEIFHLPLRRRAEIERRGHDFEARRRPLRAGENRSWQSLFFADVLRRDGGEELWAANSASSSGTLRLRGDCRRLVPDWRFRLMAQAALRCFDAETRGAA